MPGTVLSAPRILTHLNSRTCEAGVIITPILQMGKLRQSNRITQDSRVHKKHRRALNLDSVKLITNYNAFGQLGDRK